MSRSAPAEAPALRVIVVTARGADTLPATLESIATCRKPRGLRGVVVVENGPRAGAEQRVCDLRRHPGVAGLDVAYAHVATTGKSRALNRALGLLAPGELAVMTDDDVVVDADWLTAYAEAAAAYPTGHYFGGSFGVLRERVPEPALAPFLPRSATGVELCEGLAAEPDYLGFNWAVWAADLRRVGGFDVHIGPGAPLSDVGDETDVQLGLMAVGLRGRNVPGARVHHRVPSSRSSAEWLFGKYRSFGRTLAYLTHKREGNRAIALKGAKLTATFVAARAVMPFSRWATRRRLFALRRDLAVATGYREGLLYVRALRTKRGTVDSTT